VQNKKAGENYDEARKPNW